MNEEVKKRTVKSSSPGFYVGIISGSLAILIGLVVLWDSAQFSRYHFDSDYAEFSITLLSNIVFGVGWILIIIGIAIIGIFVFLRGVESSYYLEAMKQQTGANIDSPVPPAETKHYSIEDLRALKELLNLGAITQEEFDIKKAEMMRAGVL